MSTILGIGPTLKLELQEMSQQIQVALHSYHVDLEKMVAERMAKCIEGFDIEADVDCLIRHEYENWLRRNIAWSFDEAMRSRGCREQVERAVKEAIGPILDRQFGCEDKP